MKIIYNNILPPKGFIAINLFGILFVRNSCKNRITKQTINHEAIHTTQYKELFYLGFLILYFYYWVRNLFIIGFNHKAYKNIPFELEAYYNEGQEGYLINRPKFSWKNYINFIKK